jgi:hypothetical protein
MFLPHFSADELRCKGSGLLILAPGFGAALQGLRDALALRAVELGLPPTWARMSINSACRSAAHNAAVGGHPRSLHVCDKPARPTGGCCAVDVGCPLTEPGAEHYRSHLSALAWARGWSVGDHPLFLHLDQRTAYAGLPQRRFDY